MEILLRTQGVHAVVGLGGHLAVAEQVMLDSEWAHVVSFSQCCDSVGGGFGQRPRQRAAAKEGMEGS
ncbi:MAG: hypothetical protein ACREVW_08220, partial [Burkholderiales bacterium]